MAIELYEVVPEYIDYLLPYAPHLFQNKKPEQIHERKYIGIILEVNATKYFAPLSSFKPKHEKMNAKAFIIQIASQFGLCAEIVRKFMKK